MLYFNFPLSFRIFSFMYVHVNVHVESKCTCNYIVDTCTYMYLLNSIYFPIVEFLILHIGAKYSVNFHINNFLIVSCLILLSRNALILSNKV